MKTRLSLICMFFILTAISAFSQEKSKSELRNERKLEKQSQIAEMVDAREFVFIARTAQPTGHRSVNLTSNPNFVKFHPDLIDGDMPYFGRAYSGVAYGGDGGLKFSGTPEDYTITKNKKNYLVKGTVKGAGDVFSIALSVGFEGSASLTINSNNRASISYIGDISAPVKTRENK